MRSIFRLFRAYKRCETQSDHVRVHPRCRQGFLRHLLRAGGLRVNVVDPLQDGSDGFSKLLLKFRHALVELSGSGEDLLDPAELLGRPVHLGLEFRDLGSELGNLVLEALGLFRTDDGSDHGDNRPRGVIVREALGIGEGF